MGYAGGREKGDKRINVEVTHWVGWKEMKFLRNNMNTTFNSNIVDRDRSDLFIVTRYGDAINSNTYFS